MKITELEKRYLLAKACSDVGKWNNILDTANFYPGSLKDLRNAADRVIDFVDLIELDQYRGGNNPRARYSDDG